jgi:hypothetical protein
VCIKYRRKKETEGQTQEKEKPCTETKISAEMDLVAVVEREIVKALIMQDL